MNNPRVAAVTPPPVLRAVAHGALGDPEERVVRSLSRLVDECELTGSCSLVD